MKKRILPVLVVGLIMFVSGCIGQEDNREHSLSLLDGFSLEEVIDAPEYYHEMEMLLRGYVFPSHLDGDHMVCRLTVEAERDAPFIFIYPKYKTYFTFKSMNREYYDQFVELAGKIQYSSSLGFYLGYWHVEPILLTEDKTTMVTVTVTETVPISESMNNYR
jgi:hypothetical protein